MYSNTHLLNINAVSRLMNKDALYTDFAGVKVGENKTAIRTRLFYGVL